MASSNTGARGGTSKGGGKASPAALGDDYYKGWMKEKKQKKIGANMFPKSPASPNGK